MTGPLDEPEHATPLTTEERQGLIPSHVTLRRELNELEQQNILEAVTWAFSRKHDPVKETFGRGLHKRMFGKVWRWAGSYRTSNKNLGVEFWQVNPRLMEVLDNVAFWIKHESYSPDEIAVRFHHNLVFIHPFPNGNGRWSRLMADILIKRLGGQPFSWGRSALSDADETRKIYVAALKTADNHDFTGLLAFARS